MKPSARLILQVQLFLLAMALTGPLHVAAGMIEVRVGGGPLIKKPVTSLKEARFKKVVAQKLEFSCGAAALATILNYHYGKEVSEQEIIEDMFEAGERQLIRTKGFSLLDMKRYAEKIGFRAGGYKITHEQLQKIQSPAIVLLNTRNYSHFVVFKQLKDGDVYLADPAMGNKIMSVGDFMKAWNNVILLVEGPRTGDPAGLSMEARKRPDNEMMRAVLVDLSFLHNPAEF